MKSRFSLARNRPGIYFNDGKIAFSVQVPQERTGEEGPLLVAIKAAREEFCRVYFSGPNEAHYPPRLRAEPRPTPDAGGAE